MRLPSENATGLQRGAITNGQNQLCVAGKDWTQDVFHVIVLACILSRLSYPNASQQALLSIHVDTMTNDRESDLLLGFVGNYSWFVDSVGTILFSLTPRV